jgi:hypothetical protein
MFVASRIRRNRGLTVTLPNTLLILVRSCCRLSGDFHQHGLLIVFHNTDGYSSILLVTPALMSPQKNMRRGSEDESEDESSEVAVSASKKLSSNDFGPIPRFSRVYELRVEQASQDFSCTCCHQQRMGMPCRYIASVCRGNDTILGPNALGFPLSSIRAFWWNQYYLYGMSEKEDHQKIRGALLALADNDTQGLPCPTNLDRPSVFPCPESVIALFIFQPPIVY